jgi:hypothetical protein
VKIEDSMGKTSLFLGTCLQPLGNVSYMAASRSSKKTRKLTLYPILNIVLFSTHTELELGMLGVARKLAKDIV